MRRRGQSEDMLLLYFNLPNLVLLSPFLPNEGHHVFNFLKKKKHSYSIFCLLNCLYYSHEMIRWEMFWKIMAWGSDSGAPVVKLQDVTIVKRAPNCSYYSVLIVA